MKSYSLWIDKKKQPKIYQKKLVYNKNNKTVLVKTIYSGISKGTEKLVSSKSVGKDQFCLLYTSPSPRDATLSRMPSSA